MTRFRPGPAFRILAFSGLGGVVLAAGAALAGSSTTGEEFLSVFEAVPPNVLFLIDLSNDMDEDCSATSDTGDTGGSDTVTFDDDIQPILADNCALSGCHDSTTAQQGLDLSGDSFENIVGIPATEVSGYDLVEPGDPAASYLYRKVYGDHADIGGTGVQMPKDATPLSSGEIQLIYDWIADGAEKTDNPTYYLDTDIQPIFTDNCALSGCHDDASASGGLVLTEGNTYVNTVNAASTELPTMDLVEPGIAEDSYLWHKLEGTHLTVGGSGVQMPNGSAPLDSADLDKIKTWILEGAPETKPTISGTTCLDEVIDAIDQLTQHYDWAYFGVAGTTDSPSDNSFYPIAPLKSDHDDIETALASVSAHGGTVRNLGEALAALSEDYFDLSVDGDPTVEASWNNAPIDYHCQENHVITLAIGTPHHDKNPATYASSGLLSKDVKCDSSGARKTSGTDVECLYDNVVYKVWTKDHRSDLTGTQNIITHTVGIKVDGTSVTEELFGNSVDQIDNEGVYTVSNSGSEILGDIMTVMSYIRSGFYSRSTPVISADGERMIYAFYEITGDNPLAEGHIRGYEIDTDPASSTYGEVLYNGDDQFGGALWDGGDLLVSRPVTHAESQEDDQDGMGRRDIYTFVPELMAETSSSLYDEATSDERMGFDLEWVDVAGDTDYIDNFMDTTDLAYDLDGDGVVDASDLQEMVDFVRGLPSAEYRYLDQERGYWKLGDSPHSVPVVVSGARKTFTTEPSYDAFLDQLVALDVPDIVLIAANDGMLHAFRLYDDPTTNAPPTGLGSTEDADEAGEELWAWIPGYVLYRNPGEDWSGRIMDMLWYGRTFLFDGSPVVEDVWIDADGDGVRECDDSDWPDSCEWHRIVVASQGQGGPVVLALDITDPQDPRFLWEQVNMEDIKATGYTVSRPVVANVLDASASDATDWRDRYVVFWGSGRGVPDADYYTYAEANLYMWAVEDDYWDDQETAYEDMVSAELFDPQGSNIAPEASVATGLDLDGDGRDEWGYISGAPTGVDVDGDGDMDVLYMPVTVSYKPVDMGGSGPDGGSEDPGYTWMYKAILDTEDLGNPTWCEFYDPYDYIGARPEVYYAATAAWHTDGKLGIYWGTGTPYDRDSTDPGYLFAVKDPTPLTCGTVEFIDACGDYGAYELDAGEGLTAEPIVYAGTIYFSTYVPDSDRCNIGTGRIYGLSYTDCSSELDTNGDGVVDDSDADYIEVEGYPSGVAISDQGTIFYGSSNPDVTKSGASAVGVITVANDPFLGTETIMLREVF